MIAYKLRKYVQSLSIRTNCWLIRYKAATLLYSLGRDSITQLLKADTLLDLLDLTQEYPSHHDMRSNPDAVDWKASVELEWTATFQGLHCTVKRPSVWILSSGIRLHLLDLCLHIIEGQTASRCKES